MVFSDVVAWIAGLVAVLHVIACVFMRDLLRGKVPEAQLHAHMPSDALWSAGLDENGVRVHAVRAQRGQWLALVATTVAAILWCRPVGWWVEGHTAPGVAWIAVMAAALLGGMWSADSLLYSVNPKDRTGRSRITTIIRANHLWAAACMLLVILPWFIQHPQPRDALQDEFVTYYQPTLASLLSTLGAVFYLPVATWVQVSTCWKAARDEWDSIVRLSLRMVALGAVAALGIAGVHIAQGVSWFLGHPLWSEQSTAMLHVIICVVMSSLTTSGIIWVPLAENHRERSHEFLVPLWREDVTELRPMWLRLLSVHHGEGAYEPDSDMVTATTAAGLKMQRRRISTEVEDMLARLADCLSTQGRQRVQAILRSTTPEPTLRHRLLRLLAAAILPVLRVTGGRFPERATAWWTRLAAAPLASLAPVDAACVLAAIEVKSSMEERQRRTTRLLTPTLRSTDERVAYLRAVIDAWEDDDVKEAATGAYVEMKYGPLDALTA